MRRPNKCVECGADHRRLLPNGLVFSGVHGFQAGFGTRLGCCMGVVKDDDLEEFFRTVSEAERQDGEGGRYITGQF